MNLLEMMERSRAQETPASKASERQKSVSTSQTAKSQPKNTRPFDDANAEMRTKAHVSVVSIISKSSDVLSESELHDLIDSVVNEVAAELPRGERLRMHQDIYHEITGLGPLEKLLEDGSVSEIMVNGPYQVYIERHGKLELSDVRFRDDAHLMNIIDRIVSPLGRHIDDTNPMVDARLADGSRVNAIIAPLSLKGPILTIRKFAETPLEIEDLISFGSLDRKMAAFLEACVKGKLNMVVSGGTGSGKTTLLNVLSGYIPANERIVTIEDAAELQLRQDHVVTLESRPANLEGTGQITIRDLVRNALRMRPDRIVVGEVRGGEALDMLQAMNTGHDGSLTTAHANSPRDLLARLETMVLMAGMNLPVTAIRQQVSSALDVIVQQNRFRDGSRKVTSVCEVLGMEGDVIITQEVFHFQQSEGKGAVTGRFLPSGVVPHCLDKLEERGITVDSSWFS